MPGPTVDDSRHDGRGASNGEPAQRGDAQDVAPADPRSRAAAWDRLYDAALDEMAVLLREQAKAWAARLDVLRRLDDLSSLGAKAGTAQFPQLEMAGSWQVSQITATRWQGEAARFAEALPRTLAMLTSGDLLEHQAKVLLHRTAHCAVEVARAVEERVLPEGARLCPSDLSVRVDRAVLRIESERAEAAAAEHRRAEAVAQRRTFAKPLPDGMALAGAVLTAEQMVGWQAGMDALERRERIADREAGVDRTAEQRRADLFAALPSMVLAGTAQDRVAVASESSGAGASAARQPWTFGPEQLAAHVVLNVHVPVSTVLDLSREPGSLERYGPVSAEHIRLLRPRSWRRVMVDGASGRPIALDDRPTPVDRDPERARAQVLEMLRPDVVVDADELQHDPSARLARLVDVRDVRCCGPGCSTTRTHRDHLEPHPSGATSARNLGRLSARCHRAKHAEWTLERHPDGSTRWTSPIGRVYDRPSPHAPPPQVDLHAELPPLRPRPVSSLADDQVDTSSRHCADHADGVGPGDVADSFGTGDHADGVSPRALADCIGPRGPADPVGSCDHADDVGVRDPAHRVLSVGDAHDGGDVLPRASTPADLFDDPPPF